MNTILADCFHFTGSLFFIVVAVLAVIAMYDEFKKKKI